MTMEAFECDKCGAVFATPEELEKHEIESH